MLPIIPCIGAVLLGLVAETTETLAANSPQPRTRTLHAISSFGGASEYGRIMEVAPFRDGILLLDGKSDRLVFLDEQREPLFDWNCKDSDNFFGSWDFDVYGQDEGVILADTGNGRVLRMDESGDCEQWATGFPIRTVCSWNGLIAQRASTDTTPLIDLVDRAGQPVRTVGERVSLPGAGWPEHEALNRLRLASSAEGQLVVAYQTLSQIAIFNPDHTEAARFDVRGTHFDLSREWFLEQLQADTGYVPDGAETSYDLLVHEIEVACSDGAPHGNNYINDVDWLGNDVIAIVYGAAYLYSQKGQLKAVWTLRDEEGGEIYLHGVCVLSSDRFLAWDSVHERRVYEFSRDHLSNDR